jgi:hypothetical protein
LTATVRRPSSAAGTNTGHGLDVRIGRFSEIIKPQFAAGG